MKWDHILVVELFLPCRLEAAGEKMRETTTPFRERFTWIKSITKTGNHVGRAIVVAGDKVLVAEATISHMQKSCNEHFHTNEETLKAGRDVLVGPVSAVWDVVEVREQSDNDALPEAEEEHKLHCQEFRDGLRWVHMVMKS